MSRELLADLAGYKSYRDKGVTMAARSLVQLYRTVRPELLQRKDRVGGCVLVQRYTHVMSNVYYNVDTLTLSPPPPPPGPTDCGRSTEG